MKYLFVGADWVMKYLIGKMLLDDQDQEDDITVFDTTQTVNEFYDFPPLQKSAGDERLTVANTLDVKKCIKEYGPFDVVIVNTNVIDHVQQLIEAYSWTTGEPYSKENRTVRFFVISSWEVYGWKKRQKIPISEDEKTKPTTLLGETKQKIEEMMTYAFPCTIFRLATIFGPYMPDDTEIMQWLMTLVLSRPVTIAQPAGRKLDLCYVYNVLEPMQKAFTKTDLPPIINIGSADSDYKKDGKINVFEKNVMEALMGLRVLIDSRSSLAASDEDVTKFQGQGFHSQLKTALARKYLDYYPITDTLKGFLQTCHWLQKRMELDPQYQGYTGRSIEEIYPTLDEKKMQKVGEELHYPYIEKDVEEFKENLYQQRKIEDKAGRIARSDKDIETLVCKECKHVPSSVPSETCRCGCHSIYQESEDVI